MKRLTRRYDVADRSAHMVCAGACIDDDEMCGCCPELGKIVDRLAAYEDTGLTPEEIAKMHTGKIVDNLFDEEFGTPEQRLKAYEDAEEQGLLVRLPCKVGDTIFMVFANGEIRQRTVNMISTLGSGWAVHYGEACEGCVGSDDFGDWVFLTREEAEAALAKDANAPDKEG